MAKGDSLGKKAGKIAAKVTVRHAVHGTASKVKRKPLRSATLLAIGGSVGALSGWVAGRMTARPSQDG
jgi:hypothetical protein